MRMRTRGARVAIAHTAANRGVVLAARGGREVALGGEEEEANSHGPVCVGHGGEERSKCGLAREQLASLARSEHDEHVRYRLRLLHAYVPLCRRHWVAWHSGSAACALSLGPA
jgi:hypothetical protein